VLLVLAAGVYGDLRRTGVAPDLPVVLEQVTRQLGAAAGQAARFVPATTIALRCEATPIVQREGAAIAWRVRFMIDSVDLEADAIRLNARIERTGDAPDRWTPYGLDDAIWLQGQRGRAALIEQGGVFAQETTLLPGQSYSGWMRFERLPESTFELVHPNIQPRFTLDLPAGSCATETQP
jgi:hypothetical protein